MSTFICAVYEQAVKTFLRKPNSMARVLGAQEFANQFAKLEKILSEAVDPAELGLDKSEVLSLKDPNSEYDYVASNGHVHSKAATYIAIDKVDDVSIGIFVVHPGKKLPLHNHPGMHGLLKCIAGRFQVNSYSELDPGLNLVPPLSVTPSDVEKRVIPTVATSTVITPSSKPCILTPTDNNFHEIRALGDACAVFLDILSPPYHESMADVREGEDIRDCDYYMVGCTEERGSGEPPVTWLCVASESEIKAFRTRGEPYQGPKVGSTEKEGEEEGNLKKGT